MYSQEEIIDIINRLITIISVDIPIEKAYLFGSYAKGTQKNYSDIDLALVSNYFEGTRFFDRKKLAKYLVKVNTDVEVHPFKTEDFIDDNPFVEEILRTGIRILI